MSANERRKAVVQLQQSRQAPPKTSPSPATSFKSRVNARRYKAACAELTVRRINAVTGFSSRQRGRAGDCRSTECGAPLLPCELRGEKSPGVRAGEAIICLEANLDDLSRNCKKAVLTALGVDSEAEPVADAAPTPTPRAPSRAAPIVSTKPPGLNADAQRAERRNAPVAATKEAADEPPPPKFATPRRGRTAHEAEAATDSLQPDSASADQAPPERAATSPSERVETLPPEEVVEPEPRSAAPARRTRTAPPRTSNPLVRACWNELVQNCRGIRPGGGRELACLTRHSRSLSPECWQPYRSAHRSSRR